MKANIRFQYVAIVAVALIILPVFIFGLPAASHAEGSGPEYKVDCSVDNGPNFEKQMNELLNRYAAQGYQLVTFMMSCPVFKK